MQILGKTITQQTFPIFIFIQITVAERNFPNLIVQIKYINHFYK